MYTTGSRTFSALAATPVRARSALFHLDSYCRTIEYKMIGYYDRNKWLSLIPNGGFLATGKYKEQSDTKPPLYLPLPNQVRCIHDIVSFLISHFHHTPDISQHVPFLVSFVFSLIILSSFFLVWYSFSFRRSGVIFSRNLEYGLATNFSC